MGGPPCTTRTKCLARSLIKQFCDASRLLAAKAKFHSSMKFSSKQKSHQSPCSFLPSSFAGKPTSRKSGGGEGGGRRIYDEFSRDSRSTEKGKWALKCHLRRSNRLFPSFLLSSRSLAPTVASSRAATRRSMGNARNFTREMRLWTEEAVNFARGAIKSTLGLSYSKGVAHQGKIVGKESRH